MSTVIKVKKKPKPWSHEHSGMPHGNKKDVPKYKLTFLQALRDGCSPSKAAAKADIAYRSAILWRRQDPEFARQWAEASEQGVDLLEDEARRRAVDGVLRAVYHAGEVVGHELEYSDSLLALLLKGRRSEVYQPDRYNMPAMIAASGPVNVTITMAREKIAGLTDKELERLALLYDQPKQLTQDSSKEEDDGGPRE